MGMYREYLEKLYQKEGATILTEDRPFDREKTDADGEKLFSTVVSRDVEWFNEDKNKVSFNKLQLPLKKKQADLIQKKFSQIAEEVEKDSLSFIKAHPQLFPDKKTKEKFINTAIVNYLFNLLASIDGYKRVLENTDAKSRGLKDFYRAMTMWYQPAMAGKTLDAYYFYYTKGDGSAKTTAKTFLDSVIQAKDQKKFAKEHSNTQSLDEIMEKNIITRPRSAFMDRMFKPAQEVEEEAAAANTSPRPRR